MTTPTPAEAAALARARRDYALDARRWRSGWPWFAICAVQRLRSAARAIRRHKGPSE